MSGAINSRGRRGSTVVPNWRWEDPALDCYTLRVAGWLASHADSYLDAHVGRNQIAKHTNISRERVSTSLERLAQLGIIEIFEATNSRMRIVFDFDAWEGSGGRHTSTEWTPHVHQVDATRPLLEDISEKPTGEPPQPPASQGAVEPADSSDFEAFWVRYPRKIGKPAARRAWKNARLKFVYPEIISAGLNRWIDYWVARNEPQFIPHPATWLNQERWNDAPPPLPRASSTRGGRTMDVLTRLAEGKL